MTQERSYQRTIRAWTLYDWANSAFATTIMAAVLPTFYSSVAAVGLPRVTASAYWGYTQTISMLLVALLAPALGAIADYSGTKKRFLAAFAIPGMLATSLLVFVSTGDWLLASGIYVLGQIGFAGSIIFYDSLLPHIARPEDIDVVSTRGYAMGYLGGGLLLAINIGWIMAPSVFGIEALGTRFGVSGTEMASRLSFLSVGIWWALFSIPLFRQVPEPPPARLRTEERMTNPVVGGFARLVRTFRELRLYRQLLIFIIAFWIYNDGIGTIIKMATIYGSEIGIGQVDLIGALLLTQFVGIPFSLMFGRIPRRGDPNQAFFLSLIVYNAVTTPLLSMLLPTFGITSGPLAVGVVLANQVLAYTFSRLLGRHLLAGFARRIGTKEAILLALVVYTIVSIWGYFMHTAAEFWLLAWMVGLVQGGSQALSRSLFGNMVPKAQTAEFFGFYDMSSKFAGLVGPLLFAVVGQAFGSSRLSIVSLVIFFIVGGFILARVDEKEGVRLARQVDAETAMAEHAEVLRAT